MGLKHSKEVREALPKQVAESINGTSKVTAKCNCSPCNCDPCKCPEKSCSNATNGSCANGAVSEEAKPCQESKLEEGGNSQVVVTDEAKSVSQCHDDEPEVNADEVAQKDPKVEELKQESTPPRKDDQPTPEAEEKPVVEEVATSPVTSVEEAEQTNITQESTTQAEGEQAVTGSSEQQSWLLPGFNSFISDDF